MHFGFQLHAAHAQRVAHVVLAINNEFLRQNMQNLLICWQSNRARGFYHAVNIHLRDFSLFNFDHAMRIKAFNMAARNASKHGINLAICHQFRFFNRALNGLHGGININHHAFFKAARHMLTKANYL